MQGCLITDRGLPNKRHAFNLALCNRQNNASLGPDHNNWHLEEDQETGYGLWYREVLLQFWATKKQYKLIKTNVDNWTSKNIKGT